MEQAEREAMYKRMAFERLNAEIREATESREEMRQRLNAALAMFVSHRKLHREIENVMEDMMEQMKKANSCWDTGWAHTLDRVRKALTEKLP